MIKVMLSRASVKDRFPTIRGTGLKRGVYEGVFILRNGEKRRVRGRVTRQDGSFYMNGADDKSKAWKSIELGIPPVGQKLPALLQKPLERVRG